MPPDINGPPRPIAKLNPNVLLKKYLPFKDARASTGINSSQASSWYPGGGSGSFVSAKNLASFVGNKNIRVNCVSPAFIYTDLTKNILDDEFIGTKLKDQHPMKRFGTPEEVAETICFLASDKASFITGVDLPCDGGYLIL